MDSGRESDRNSGGGRDSDGGNIGGDNRLVELAGLILAGGAGRRFGGPKAWAVLPDGRNFLEACTATLVAAGARPVAATLPPGSRDPAVDKLLALPLPEAGLDMFASIRIGIGRLMNERSWTRVALLPVDHPLVRAETLSVLAAGRSRAVIPSFHGKHGHPVVIDRPAAEAVVNGALPGPTLREVLATIGCVAVDVDDPGTTANCNSPAALAAALSRQ
jgi:CTP:molybdopterin cytidylyltransferase MocA